MIKNENKTLNSILCGISHYLIAAIISNIIFWCLTIGMTILQYGIINQNSKLPKNILNSITDIASPLLMIALYFFALWAGVFQSTIWVRKKWKNIKTNVTVITSITLAATMSMLYSWYVQISWGQIKEGGYVPWKNILGSLKIAGIRNYNNFNFTFEVVFALIGLIVFCALTTIYFKNNNPQKIK